MYYFNWVFHMHLKTCLPDKKHSKVIQISKETRDMCLAPPGFFQVRPWLPLWQGVSAQPIPVLNLSLTSVAQASAPSPCPYWQTSISSWGVQGSLTDMSVQVTLHLALLRLVGALSSLAPKLPLHPSWSSYCRRAFPEYRSFPPS